MVQETPRFRLSFARRRSGTDDVGTPEVVIDITGFDAGVPPPSSSSGRQIAWGRRSVMKNDTTQAKLLGGRLKAGYKHFLALLGQTKPEIVDKVGLDAFPFPLSSSKGAEPAIQSTSHGLVMLGTFDLLKAIAVMHSILSESSPGGRYVRYLQGGNLKSLLQPWGWEAAERSMTEIFVEMKMEEAELFAKKRSSIISQKWCFSIYAFGLNTSKEYHFTCHEDDEESIVEDDDNNGNNYNHSSDFSNGGDDNDDSSSDISDTSYDDDKNNEVNSGSDFPFDDEVEDRSNGDIISREELLHEGFPRLGLTPYLFDSSSENRSSCTMNTGTNSDTVSHDSSDDHDKDRNDEVNNISSSPFDEEDDGDLITLEELHENFASLGLGYLFDSSSKNHSSCATDSGTDSDTISFESSNNHDEGNNGEDDNVDNDDSDNDDSENAYSSSLDGTKKPATGIQRAHTSANEAMDKPSLMASPMYSSSRGSLNGHDIISEAVHGCPQDRTGLALASESDNAAKVRPSTASSECAYKEMNGDSDWEYIEI